MAHPTSKHRISEHTKLRKIKAWIHPPGVRAKDMRLWTSITDSEATADELVDLYSKRWEQELYCRELKPDISDGDPLASNLPEAVAQEIAALILATALVAQTQLESAESKRLPTVTTVSFAKALELVTHLWTAFALTSDVFIRRATMCDRRKAP